MKSNKSTVDKPRCLIISNGPVPTPEHSIVEGGGLRCWGLAQGVLVNKPNIDVTVAYNETYKSNKQDFTQYFKGVNITTWNQENLEILVRDFDTIIMSYCMGELSVKVVDIIKPNQQLILDCYVPIYVETSARGAKDIEKEYYTFMHDISRWSHVLSRGDFFLCASEEQKKYYKGVLSAVGRINPATYGQDLIIICPYGLYEEDPQSKDKPITKLIGNNETKKILWFGGIYPWFDLRNLIDAIGIVNKTIDTKLIIVGAKNPFNSHPDFLKKYQETINYINSAESIKKNVLLQEWIKFDDRANWYLDSDAVIFINKLGEENELAWRTRLIDFMWADLPILTNGGDPLSEILINKNAAKKLSGLTPDKIANDIISILDNPNKLSELKNNISKIRKDFYWSQATKYLSEIIDRKTRSKDFDKFGIKQIQNRVSPKTNKLNKIASGIKQLPRYTKKYGILNTATTIKTVAAARINKKIKKTEKPMVHFIAHQLDMSGAPYVFMDLVKDFVAKYPNINVKFHTFNPTDSRNIKLLNNMGIKPNVHLNKDIEINFTKGDVVVLNTVAHSASLKNSIYKSLDNNIVNKLVWFIHEDEPSLIFNSAEKSRLIKLLADDKMKMFIAAKKTLLSYQEFFSNKNNILIQPYKLITPKKYHNILDKNDFDKIDFILPGTVGDGRKGQLPLLYAFIEFKKRYYDIHPTEYRDFSLVYIGISDDFLSRQILKHSKKGLGDRFIEYGRVSHDECLEIVRNKANMTICYSLRECLPLFVFEGMTAGHPILRNDSSGIDEQLIDGVNGYYLDSSDFNQIVLTIEKVLNKAKTSNVLLAKMSKASYDIGVQQEKNSYDPITSTIKKGFDS